MSKIISVHSQAFKFLELVAISGEYPFTGLELALGKGRYREKIISDLKEEKMIKSFYKDKIRGYRITAAAKKQLINYNPKRFAFYIEGSVETNVKKSELSRRIRLHRMAEINVLLYQAKIEIWRDCKPIIFSPEYKARYPPVLNAPTYYSSREIKEIGLEAVKVKNSRAIGITISEDDIFILYNTGNQSMKWQYKSELRMKAVISYCLKQSKIVTHYKIESMKAIMVAESMEIAYTLMTNRNNHQNHTFILDESFEHMYFVPATMQGIILLKILHHRDILQELNEILLTDLCREKLISSNYYDAIDQENRVVLFAYDFDMPRIAKFNNSVQIRKTKGVLICFDFQKETLYKLGRYATVDIVAGDWLFASKISPLSLNGDSLPKELPVGTGAISIQINMIEGSTVSQLQTGDIIKLYHYTNNLKDIPELQFVKVLSVLPNEKQEQTTITVLALEKQSEKLTDLKKKGKLFAALISRGNDTLATDLLKQQQDFLYPNGIN